MSFRDIVVKGQSFVTAESAISQSQPMIGFMAKRFRKTYIREWRKERGLTLEKLALRVGMTTSNLSKIERGAQAYTQPALEALADALNVTPSDLITRLPGPRDELRVIWEQMSPETQTQALAILKALKGTKAA